MNAKPEDYELLPPERSYPILASDAAMQRILQLFDQNVAAQTADFDPFKLPRIKMPTGGDTDFKVETASGTEHRSSLIGIITAYRTARAYWVRQDTTGKPPDCSSKDGLVGVGNPGGDCTSCPLAKFKSAPPKRPGEVPQGQACKDTRQLLILLPGQQLPHLLALPPTSIGAFFKYSISLVSSGRDYWAVTTRMTLEPATSASGQPHARVRFSMYGELPRAQAGLLVPYQQRMQALLTPMVVDASVYEIEAAPEAQALPETGQKQDDDVPF